MPEDGGERLADPVAIVGMNARQILRDRHPLRRAFGLDAEHQGEMGAGIEAIVDDVPVPPAQKPGGFEGKSEPLLADAQSLLAGRKRGLKVEIAGGCLTVDQGTSGLATCPVTAFAEPDA